MTSCICFGTPFYGAEFAKVSLAWNAVHRLEYDDKDFSELLGTLTPNNRKLLELTAGFQSIVERMDPPTTVFCFYEKKEKDWEEHIQEMHTQLNKEKVRPGPKGTTLVQKPSLPVPEDVIKQLGAFKKKVSCRPPLNAYRILTAYRANFISSHQNRPSWTLRRTTRAV